MRRVRPRQPSSGEQLARTAARSTSGTPLVRVLYSYEAQEEDELSIVAGELVEVLSAEDDWWLGRSGERVGTFPSNYVEAATASGSALPSAPAPLLHAASSGLGGAGAGPVLVD